MLGSFGRRPTNNNTTMNSKGIFEGMPGPSEAGGAAPSPFKALSGDTEAGANPFSLPTPAPSPFAVAADEGGRPPLEPGKPARIPEPRARAGGSSPFQLAEPAEGFGFEPEEVVAPFGGSPFAVAAEPARSPLRPVPEFETPEPLRAVEPPPPPPPPPSPPPPPPVRPVEAVQPVRPAPAPAPEVTASPAMLDSSGIRQLELRAIFGVDRELSPEEIMQRLRSLPGIRNLARVGEEGLGAIDVLRRSLAGLAKDGAQLRVVLGGSPVEFIREGRIVLAVMNDGSFAPGVRETIIIAARELGRMG